MTDAEIQQDNMLIEEDMPTEAALNQVLAILTEVNGRLAVLEARPPSLSQSEIQVIAREVVDNHPRIKALDDTRRHLEDMVEKVAGIGRTIQETFSRETTDRIQSQRLMENRLGTVESGMTKVATTLDRVERFVEARAKHGDEQDRQIKAVVETQATIARDMGLLTTLYTLLSGYDLKNPGVKIGPSVIEQINDLRTEQKRSNDDNTAIRQTLTAFTEQQRGKMEDLVKDNAAMTAFMARYEQAVAIRRMVWEYTLKAVKSRVFQAAFGSITGGAIVAALIKAVEILGG